MTPDLSRFLRQSAGGRKVRIDITSAGGGEAGGGRGGGGGGGAAGGGGEGGAGERKPVC